MQSTAIPPKFPVPFASSASAANVRAIPLGSQAAITPGAASLADGFPAVNFTPVSAGGIPPFGQDMNGILQQITAWVRWLSGGMPVTYDATFASLIGGYPKGTILSSTTNGGVWLSQVENNSTNPDAGGAGWISLFAPLAPLASPALTGTPTAPTAARSTNTSQIATTAFVLGQAAVVAPIMDGIATIGVSTGYARADHIHPTDTSLAPQHNWSFFTSGNNTFVVPAGVTRLVVSVISGGGAGGTGGAYPGGGGGAGGRAKSIITGVSPGQVFYAFAGSGGVPSVAAGYGGNGVAAAFSNSSNVTLVSASAGTGGAGNIPNPAGGAGGGWLAGQFGDGGSWGSDGISSAGKGGDGGGPGSGRGTTGTYLPSGIAANGFGGGGGGGALYSPGGAGGGGLVIVEW